MPQVLRKTKMVQAGALSESPLFWPAEFRNGVVRVLDETLVPEQLHYIELKSCSQAVNVIRKMKTRAFGQFLVVLNTFLLEITQTGNIAPQALVDKIIKTAEALNRSRPTFPFSEVTSIVVEWAQVAVRQQQDVGAFITKNILGYLAGIRARRLDRVRRIAEVIKDGDSVLTHCNVSGELAMAAVLCRTQDKEVHFFATETRPYFQGAKLTAWELKRLGAQVTLIADNAIGSVMADGLVNKVVVGSDRSCANGDFANKIGTYQIAVLAEEFGIPFYVLAQPSDTIKKGADIPIEIRSAKELLKFSGKKVIPGAVDGFYPGFDVVPHSLVTKWIPIDVR